MHRNENARMRTEWEGGSVRIVDESIDRTSHAALFLARLIIMRAYLHSALGSPGTMSSVPGAASGEALFPVGRIDGGLSSSSARQEGADDGERRIGHMQH